VWRQWIVPGVLTALVVAGLTVLVGLHLADRPSSSAVGRCYAVVAGKKSAGLAVTDCSADDAAYRTALTVESPDWSLDPGTCPDGPYRAHRPSLTDDTSCLVLNVREGDCLNRVEARKGTKSDLGKGRCDMSSESKVTKVVTGPRLSCGPGEKTTFYPQPATTICLRKP
jgi:hypothetical protein